jgi:hypothetical protein
MKRFLFLLVLFISYGILAQNSVGEPNFAYASQDEKFNYRQGENNNQTVLNSEKVEITEADLPLIKDDLLAEGSANIYEGMYTFTKDKKIVFFSVNRKIKGKGETSGNTEHLKNAVNLNLFKATVNEQGAWVNLEMLPFNSSQFSTGQPTLNQDDTKLYFVSDNPRSLGRTDIFSVDLYKDGTYGIPVNLGPKINSSEREIFPYIDSENVLYFSSDVSNPKKEMDVFATKIFDHSIAMPYKLKTSVFTEKDDLASIKKTGKGAGEMYEIVAAIPVKKYFDCRQKISGVVMNADTRELLPNVKIELFDQDDKNLGSFNSGEKDASFSFEQSCNANYTLRAYREGYSTGELKIKTINDLDANPLAVVVHLKANQDLKKDLVAELPKSEISETAVPIEINAVQAAPVEEESKSDDQLPYDFNSELQIYTVQIGAFQVKAKTEEYIKVTDLFNHNYEDGFNRYYSGIFASSTEAKKHLIKMKNEGFYDAFVVGLKGENRF